MPFACSRCKVYMWQDRHLKLRISRATTSSRSRASTLARLSRRSRTDSLAAAEAGASRYTSRSSSRAPSRAPSRPSALAARLASVDRIRTGGGSSFGVRSVGGGESAHFRSSAGAKGGWRVWLGKFPGCFGCSGRGGEGGGILWKSSTASIAVPDDEDDEDDDDNIDQEARESGGLGSEGPAWAIEAALVVAPKEDMRPLGIRFEPQELVQADAYACALGLTNTVRAYDVPNLKSMLYAYVFCLFALLFGAANDGIHPVDYKCHPRTVITYS